MQLRPPCNRSSGYECMLTSSSLESLLIMLGSGLRNSPGQHVQSELSVSPSDAHGRLDSQNL